MFSAHVSKKAHNKMMFSVHVSKKAHNKMMFFVHVSKKAHNKLCSLFLGKVVSGYLVTTDSRGRHHWTLIGKKDPLLPQMFYPVANQVSISEGDILAARCTMVSERRTVTYIGQTNKDEMCNFYLMYYVDEGEPLEQKYCFSRGPPLFYWQSLLNSIPDKDALHAYTQFILEISP
ncbi:hypothetical protein J6590_044045 [Homalodisca vitripennis]|nr:hypothetical protein J6590_044045 [Homalodisca vitripennis]